MYFGILQKFNYNLNFKTELEWDQILDFVYPLWWWVNPNPLEKSTRLSTDNELYLWFTETHKGNFVPWWSDWVRAECGASDPQGPGISVRKLQWDNNMEVLDVPLQYLLSYTLLV